MTRGQRNIKNGILFALPWLIGFGLLVIYPLYKMVQLGFTEYNILMPAEFIGLKNFKALFEDKLFWKSAYNTLYYSFFAIPIGLVVSLGLALLVNQKLKGISIFRTIFYLPSVTPLVASAILWMWLLNPRVGMINSFLQLIGINGPGWLSSPVWSKPAIILMAQWGAGGAMLIFLAGLNDIPESFYEAAVIDGASKLQQFFKITLPLLSPTILLNLIMGIISGVQIFTQGYIMTNGGPVDSTLFYNLYLFRNAFSYFKMGYASTMAVILFVFTILLSSLTFYLSNKWVYYES